MVTLNFTMHREIATMLEEAAYQQLKILENKKLGWNRILSSESIIIYIAADFVFFRENSREKV
jgi:hypothetical protein